MHLLRRRDAGIHACQVFRYSRASDQSPLVLRATRESVQNSLAHSDARHRSQFPVCCLQTPPSAPARCRNHKPGPTRNSCRQHPSTWRFFLRKIHERSRSPRQGSAYCPTSRCRELSQPALGRLASALQAGRAQVPATCTKQGSGRTRDATAHQNRATIPSSPTLDFASRIAPASDRIIVRAPNRERKILSIGSESKHEVFP